MQVHPHGCFSLVALALYLVRFGRYMVLINR